MLVESIFNNINLLLHSNFVYIRMNSEEISSEIIKIEREISEMKREYKNLLIKSTVY